MVTTITKTAKWTDDKTAGELGYVLKIWKFMFLAGVAHLLKIQEFMYIIALLKHKSFWIF